MCWNLFTFSKDLPGSCVNVDWSREVGKWKDPLRGPAIITARRDESCGEDGNVWADLRYILEVDLDKT